MGSREAIVLVLTIGGGSTRDQIRSKGGVRTRMSNDEPNRRGRLTFVHLKYA